MMHDSPVERKQKMKRNTFKPYTKAQVSDIIAKYFGLSQKQADIETERLAVNLDLDGIDAGSIIYGYEKNLVARKPADIKSELVSHYAFYRNNPDMMDDFIRQITK